MTPPPKNSQAPIFILLAAILVLAAIVAFVYLPKITPMQPVPLVDDEEKLKGQYLVYLGERIDDSSAVYTIYRRSLDRNQGEGAVSIYEARGMDGVLVAEQYDQETMQVAGQLIDLKGKGRGKVSKSQGVVSQDGAWRASSVPFESLVLEDIRTGERKIIDTSDRVELGYLEPVAWSSDTTRVYLKTLREAEGFIPGLWEYRLDRNELSEVAVVREQGLAEQAELKLYPALERALGIKMSFDPPGQLGAEPVGPSEIVLFDLSSGTAQTVVRDEARAFAVAEVSPDGLWVAYSYYGGPEDAETWVIPTSETSRAPLRVAAGTLVGISHDWRTIVVQDGNKLTAIGRSTNTEWVVYGGPNERLEFVGIFEVE